MATGAGDGAAGAATAVGAGFATAAGGVATGASLAAGVGAVAEGAAGVGSVTGAAACGFAACGEASGFGSGAFTSTGFGAGGFDAGDAAAAGGAGVLTDEGAGSAPFATPALAGPDGGTVLGVGFADFGSIDAGGADAASTGFDSEAFGWVGSLAAGDATAEVCADEGITGVTFVAPSPCFAAAAFALAGDVEDSAGAALVGVDFCGTGASSGLDGLTAAVEGRPVGASPPAFPFTLIGNWPSSPRSDRPPWRARSSNHSTVDRSRVDHGQPD